MRALPLVMVMLAPAMCTAEDSARELLDKMSDAVQSLNYEGTFVYTHGQNMETMHIVHGFDQRGERERLLSLTGEAREIIRDNGILTCIWPGSKSIVVEPSRSRLGVPVALPNELDHSSEYYSFSVEGQERVAGMDCRIVSIKPVDEYRFGYRLCVEKNTGMLLQSALLDNEGQHIEQVMFTSIELQDQIPAARFKPVTPAEGFNVHRVEKAHDSVRIDPAWRIAKAPPGFSITSNTRRPMAANQEPVQHIILTDGMASVSVFIAELDAEARLYEGLTQSGALHAYSRVMEDHQVTVVGEVPKETVHMIGESVRYAHAVAND